MRYTGFHRLMRFVHREVRGAWQVHFGNEIETDQLDRFRQRYKDQNLIPPSYTAMVIKSTAVAMKELIPTYPQINSMLVGFPGWRRIHTFDRISAGVAVSRNDDGQDGVVVGVIEDPEAQTLTYITEHLQQMATAPVQDVPGMRNCYYLYRAPAPIQWLIAKMGHAIPEYRRRYRGTFSLTTVGKFGVDWQLSLPLAGATIQLGFGHIRQRPVVRDGQVVPANTFNLSMTFDRLLMNGRPCAMLFERIRQILNHAEFDDAKPPDNT